MSRGAYMTDVGKSKQGTVLECTAREACVGSWVM